MKITHVRSPICFLLHRLLWPVSRVAGPAIIAGSERAYGIDISHWESSFDPARAAPGLIDFAIFKATEGVSLADDRFESFYQAARERVPVLGAYHYLRSGSTAAGQADFFLERLAGKRIEIAVCDFEATGNDLTDSFVQKAHEWGRLIRDVAPPDVKLLFYTNPSTYDSVVYPGSVRLFGQDVFAGAPWDGLWIAQYYFEPSPAKNPAMPKTRSDWVLWQYSEAGDPALHGTGGWCDQNVFNGSLPEFRSWAEAGSDPIPPDGGDEVSDEVTYSNGVRVISGRLYDSDFRAVVIPAAAIESVYYKRFSGCGSPANVTGDFVFNVTPFDASCVPNMGLRIGGAEIVPYKNYNPYLAWGPGFSAVFTHVAANFKSYAEASQVFRYVVERGVKNPNWNSSQGSIDAWAERHPRRLVGRKADGSTVVIGVRGRDQLNTGWTLHECAAYAISLGCDFLGDADGGASVQDTLLVSGVKNTFLGVPAASVRKVAVAGVIRFKSPLTGTTPPPDPEPEPGEKRVVSALLTYDDGSTETLVPQP